MKFSLAFVFFTFSIWLTDAKEIRQIGSLVPLDGWIDFKNRTKDVAPIDKLIGKLRATYAFVFHKADNVSNVGKILGKAAQERNDDYVPNLGDLLSDIKQNTTEFEESIEKVDDSVRKLQNLEEASPLASLEIINDETLADRSYDEDTEQIDSTMETSRSKFQLPYAIAQAIFRWIIGLYLSTTSHAAARTNTVGNKNALE